VDPNLEGQAYNLKGQSLFEVSVGLSFPLLQLPNQLLIFVDFFSIVLLKFVLGVQLFFLESFNPILEFMAPEFYVVAFQLESLQLVLVLPKPALQILLVLDQHLVQRILHFFHL